MNVYPDSKQIPTYGIGHKVLTSEKLKIGDAVSFDRVMQVFKEDLLKHKTLSIISSAGNLMKGVGMASFIWTHGTGAIGSESWNAWKAGEAEALLQARLKKNWDVNSPVNQERNKMDAMLSFPRVKDGVTYYYSQGSSGTFVYVPKLDRCFYDLNSALTAAKGPLPPGTPQTSSAGTGGTGIPTGAIVAGAAILAVAVGTGMFKR
jgi:GH24 family phage-related lysozyme (muramidase)